MIPQVELLTVLPDTRQCVSAETIASALGISPRSLKRLVELREWTEPLKYGRRAVWPLPEVYRLMDAFLAPDPAARRKLVDRIHAERRRAAERAMDGPLS